MTMEPKYKDKKCTCENASDRLRFEVVGKEWTEVHGKGDIINYIIFLQYDLFVCIILC